MFNMFKKKRPLVQRKVVGYITQGTVLEAWADNYLTTVTITTLPKDYNLDEIPTLSVEEGITQELLNKISNFNNKLYTVTSMIRNMRKTELLNN